jgi:hypothetical protein
MQGSSTTPARSFFTPFLSVWRDLYGKPVTPASRKKMAKHNALLQLRHLVNHELYCRPAPMPSCAWSSLTRKMKLLKLGRYARVHIGRTACAYSRDACRSRDILGCRVATAADVSLYPDRAVRSGSRAQLPDIASKSAGVARGASISGGQADISSRLLSHRGGNIVLGGVQTNERKQFRLVLLSFAYLQHIRFFHISPRSLCILDKKARAQRQADADRSKRRWTSATSVRISTVTSSSLPPRTGTLTTDITGFLMATQKGRGQH